MAPKLPVVGREVWQDNLEQEFLIINDALLLYPLIAIDTEFPGTFYSQFPAFPGGHHSQFLPVGRCQIMKANVAATKIVQLGLSLCDAKGNLPNLGSGCCCFGEVNFRDFDVKRYLHNLDSIDLLEIPRK
ncbi:hypothetical protein CJ030_MR4G026983 [Morella rubra]|uniref:Uncharacterized protein n=1 Tax=Morella rubra TaxID=262757 RepID=A0A6A1VTD0_9ROSI|nr:hypothetical protein CJ030_MR4G026983 [Morella rubra]